MKVSLFVGAVAVATALSVPAMAGTIGCKPGNPLSNTKATDCGPRYSSMIYGVGPAASIAGPDAYAYVPGPYVRTYTSYPYGYASYGYHPYVAGAGFHAGSFGLSVWAD